MVSFLRTQTPKNVSTPLVQYQPVLPPIRVTSHAQWVSVHPPPIYQHIAYATKSKGTRYAVIGVDPSTNATARDYEVNPSQVSIYGNEEMVLYPPLADA